MVVTDELREVCAWIAGRSTQVRVVEERIRDYAASLNAEVASLRQGVGPAPTAAEASLCSMTPASRETAAAYCLTLDAINFGSGWFPTLRKRQERTGYRTIASGVRRRFDEAGRWTAGELVAITATELAGWLDQDPEHELIRLFVESLHDLGANVQRLYGRSFAAVVDAVDGSAVWLVETLSEWSCFRDVSLYDGRRVPFLKRAQIAAADLHRGGVARFADIHRLTMFADNLVPHVLRLDGVLWFDPELVARIEREELIEHGSAEEIEIRACALHAVELLVAASGPAPESATAAQIDELLWNRGQLPQYKAVPRHRSRSTAY